MKTLDKLTFLIHPFCYAEIARRAASGELDKRSEAYLARENECAERWRTRVCEFSESEGLAIVPINAEPAGPTLEYHELASSVIGPRSFLLDGTGCNYQQFWSDQSDGFSQAVRLELEAFLASQGMSWNKEELHTTLHCVALARQLRDQIRDRGFSLDEATVLAEAWGASFEGCVTKYTLILRRMLRLSQTVDFSYGMTVPDAFFLLETMDAERHLLDDGLRLFLFRLRDHPVALFTLTSHFSADAPARVALKLPPNLVTVRSKQGHRLWPDPEANALPSAPFGYREDSQELVGCEDGVLQVPVTAGFVYRLAKAPAYIFASQELPYEEFRGALMAAELVEAGG